MLLKFIVNLNVRNTGTVSTGGRVAATFCGAIDKQVRLCQHIAQLVVAGDYVSSFFARCSMMTKGI